MHNSKLPPCFSFSTQCCLVPAPHPAGAPSVSTIPIIPIPFFFSSISILFWQNFKSDRPTFWLLHLTSVSEQLTASKKHWDCAYRTRFKCVSTDLQTQHTPGSPDMGKFPSYLHILSAELDPRNWTWGTNNPQKWFSQKEISVRNLGSGCSICSNKNKVSVWIKTGKINCI